MEILQAPFPYYGGKSRAAPRIWERLGDCANYVEPFAGSLAVLLGRPHAPQIETVNDKDAFIANFYRAIQPHAAPDEVAYWCDNPVNEADLHAVHLWLVGQRETFTAKVMGDPDYYDARVAGRWCWGLCCWIGGGWCSGTGPWQSVDGQLVRTSGGDAGVNRSLVHLRNAGRGVHRRRVHLGGHGNGQGIHATAAQERGLSPWLAALAQRLRRVRVCCGDWTRVLGPSVTWTHGTTGMVMDPPYSSEEDRDPGIYAVEDLQVAHAVRQWCLEHGGHPLLRIVLCGYGTVHDELLSRGWTKETWAAQGGYGNQAQGRGRANKSREMLYFSPACLSRRQPELFDWRP